VRISKEEYLKGKGISGYMKKSASKKKSGSPKRKSGSRKGFSKDKCRSHLSNKISTNMKEFEQGKWQSRKQALAVSYSQVNTAYPRCKRYFPKPKN
jgi:hypothetical protein